MIYKKRLQSTTMALKLKCRLFGNMLLQSEPKNIVQYVQGQPLKFVQFTVDFLIQNLLYLACAKRKASARSKEGSCLWG